MADDLKNKANLTSVDFVGEVYRFLSGRENYPFPLSVSVKTPLDIVGNFKEVYPSGVLAKENAAKTPVVNSTPNINPALVECGWYQSA